MTLTVTETTCARMADPTFCIEAALLADVDAYDPDTPLEVALAEVLLSETFKARYAFPKPPRFSIRETLDDASALSRREDLDGHERGDIAGFSYDLPTLGYSELHIDRSAPPLLVAHEAGHIIDPSHDETRTHAEAHGSGWREAFRAILFEVHGDEAGDAFDRAVSGAEPCTHESIE
jgi:hypothetical protein